MKAGIYLILSALFGNITVFFIVHYFYGKEIWFQIRRLFEPGYKRVITSPEDTLFESLLYIGGLFLTVPAIWLTVHFFVKYREKRKAEKV